MKVFRGVLLAAITVVSPLGVHAESGLVRAGEEIVVRLPPRSTTGSAISAAQLPSSFGSLNVIGLDAALSAATLSATSPPLPHRGELTPATPAITARCKEIRSHEPLAICEPNWVYFATATPNDPNASSQYAIPNIGLAAAWNQTTGSTDVKVAVVDTGVDYTHPDLIENIARNTAEIPANGIDDDRNGYVDDYLGFNLVDHNGDPLDLNEHGTHVAGTIGAVGNNGVGVVGMNWRVGIVPVRVLDASGAGSIAEIVGGIEYAIKRGVRIINLSLGGADYSTVFEQALDAAKDAGILTVVASGNEASVNDFFETFPANFKGSNILSVAAVDSANSLAYFSNIGPETVDLAAPGVGVLSTIPGGGYDSFDGTSMATPHVAGVAALLLSLKPQFSYLDLRSLLLTTVTPTDELSGLIVTGGVLNARAAVEAAIGRTPTRVSLKFGVKLSRAGSSLVALVRDRDGGRAGVRVKFRCAKGRIISATTKRSGKATMKLSKLTSSQHRTSCRATTATSVVTTKSNLLKLN